MSLQVYTCGDYVSKKLSSTPHQVLELLLGPTKLNCQITVYQKLNTWISDAFLFQCQSPFSNNQAANINYDKCNWIVFKCLFHIGNWIKLQTSCFNPRLSKGTNPSLKSIKFCHRFQQYHNFTSEALLCIFLNAPFTLAVPSKFLERFNQCSHHSKGSCTRSPRSVFAPGGRGLCEAGWCSAEESQVWSLLKLPPACLGVY